MNKQRQYKYQCHHYPALLDCLVTAEAFRRSPSTSRCWLSVSYCLNLVYKKLLTLAFIYGDCCGATRKRNYHIAIQISRPCTPASARATRQRRDASSQVVCFYNSLTLTLTGDGRGVQSSACSSLKRVNGIHLKSSRRGL